MKTQHNNGFSLIELLVVIAIVAILAGLAYPSYTRYVIDARRATAEGILLQVAAQQEKFFMSCGWYASALGAGTNNCNTAGTGALAMSATPVDIQGLYTLAIATDPADPTADIRKGFQVTATPVASSTQASDADCQTLTYTGTGTKGQTGPNTAGRCWRK